jgi:predicted O-methyltransferase YrrM
MSTGPVTFGGGQDFINAIKRNTIKQQAEQVVTNTDPFDHLPPDQWVQKQVEWGNQHVSGSGLVKVLQEYASENPSSDGLTGAEVGVCLGVTSEKLLADVPAIGTYYAIDNYPSYIDWNGAVISADRQELMKQHAADRLSRFGERVKFVYQTSAEFAKARAPQSLDFVFIDGDHSYDGALRDFRLYHTLVKTGGIFAGHDLNISTVGQALRDFLGDDFKKVVGVENDAWYLIKE